MREKPITPHTLRHGFALISAYQDADILTIQESLGHQDIKTTMLYLKGKCLGREYKCMEGFQYFNENIILESIIHIVSVQNIIVRYSPFPPSN
ncbi:tyrosine-type recombinase/integrase [Bacillus sp. ISL-45]|uniref:tyrosine-type recombinase/integrase n=1 Tax=Bacillus sp. ISL-45 TaxID=2819128 RepID=UPI0020358A77|nr:tyrosine-type recombinase/integrase [Bacillus sp. ISL-45]